MVFPSVPVYQDPHHPNWNQHQQLLLQQLGGGDDTDRLLLQQRGAAGTGATTLPRPELGGGATTTAAPGATRPNSMAERARQAKIPLPEPALRCPRCESNNTKFCYFNNYSLTQPRHFCKTCRRYWTRGGALRNVPVGGGCRRNKRTKSGGGSSKSSTSGASSSSSAAVTSSSTAPTILPPPPQLAPFMHMALADYNLSNMELNFAGIGNPLDAGAIVGEHYQIGSCSSSRSSINVGMEQWRSLQQQQQQQKPMQLQQFPFFGHEDFVDPAPSTASSAAAPPSCSSGVAGLASQMGSVKMEDNAQVLAAMQRQYQGLARTEQYWINGGGGGGGASSSSGGVVAWPDLSGFGAGSSSAGNN